MKKAARSKLVTSKHGAKMFEKELGEDATNFLALINKAVSQHYGEKVAKKRKDDTYRMLAKFDLLEQEGKQNPAARNMVDRQINNVTRQFVVSLSLLPSLKSKQEKEVEVVALGVGFQQLSDALQDLAEGNMREKNLSTLKELVDQLAAPKFLSDFLFEETYQDERKHIAKNLDDFFQTLMEMTGEEFEDTEERKMKNDKEAESKTTETAQSGLEEKNRPKGCAIGSCGATKIYAEKDFCGSPFCALHHFKAFPEFNREKDASLSDWMEDSIRRNIFARFAKARDKGLVEIICLYKRIKDLSQEKAGTERAEIANEILKILTETVGKEITESIKKKIQTMITPEHAPKWLFDSILPNLEKKLTIYNTEFLKTSLYKAYLQTARLPEKHREELAWQISAADRQEKGAVGFAFKPEDSKNRAKIDTNAVLQPFAVEKDRSPTIRRVRPDDTEELESKYKELDQEEKDSAAKAAIDEKNLGSDTTE